MKIEGLSPLPCPPTQWGRRVGGVHLVLPQLGGGNRFFLCQSDQKPFVSCAWPFSGLSLYGPGS